MDCDVSADEGVLPPPLRGRVGERRKPHPPPLPPPLSLTLPRKGGGDRAEQVAAARRQQLSEHQSSMHQLSKPTLSTSVEAALRLAATFDIGSESALSLP